MTAFARSAAAGRGILRRAAVASLALVMLAAIHRPAGAAPAVTVFAAASLKNALDAIAAKWQAESGTAVTISYAASSLLAKQIEQGAPADLFISADLEWMDYLQERRLVDPQTRHDLLGNSLVLVAPRDSPAQIDIAPGFALARLLGDGRLAMAEPNSVPAGRYGKAALMKLGVWEDVAARVASADSVRAALALVARGETPLGIVYKTDAAVEPGVRIVAAFPADSHQPITYPMALTAGAGAATAAFAAYLRGPACAAIFETQGFTVLSGER